MRLTTQLALAIFLVVLFSNLMSLGVTGLSLRGDAEQALVEKVKAASAAVASVTAYEHRVLEGSAIALANTPVLRAALGGQLDDTTLQGIADEQRTSQGVDLLVLADGSGVVRAVSPKGSVDPKPWLTGNPPLVAAGSGAAFVLSSRMIDVRNQQVGQVIVGRRIGQPFLERLTPENAIEAVLLVDGQVRASSTHSANPELLAVAIGQRRDVGPLQIGDEVYVAGARELAPQVVVAVARGRSEEFQRFSATLWRLLLVGAFSIAITLAATFVLLGRIMRRMQVLIGNLVKTVAELRDSSTSIKSACSDQSASSTQQASAVEETRRTMESLLDSATRISQAAQLVSRNASETNRSTGAIGESVQMLVAESQKITEISETIRAVAEKSDLLALNASLEGTRAGEAGHGFSLVAGEMRRLAEHVAQAAREIQKITSSIRRPLDESVANSAESKRLAEATADSALQISEVTQQQRVATQQVTQTMDEVKTLLGHAAHTTHETNRAAIALSTLADRISTLTNDFNREVASRG